MRLKHRRLAFGCVVLAFGVPCLVVGCGDLGPEERVISAQERVTAAMAADIDRFASQILGTGIVPGMSLAVGDLGGHCLHPGVTASPTWSLSSRPTADTQFYIASTTKALTALARRAAP